MAGSRHWRSGNRDIVSVIRRKENVIMIFQADFSKHTEEDQPYSMKSELTHKYTSHDMLVEDGALLIRRSHVKQLLLIPAVRDFELSMKIFFKKPPKRTPFRNWAWGIYFGYDAKERTGHKLAVEYRDDQHMAVLSLREVRGVTETVVEEELIDDVTMEPETQQDLLLSACGDDISVSFLEKEIIFHTGCHKGIIALSKDCGITDIGISELRVQGEDRKSSCIYEKNFIIPRTDGGVADYYLAICVSRFDDEESLYDITYELTGGAYENHDDLQNCDLWTREHDTFWGLYFSFGNGRFYISNDKIFFCDNNYPYFRDVVGGSDIPYRGSFRTTAFDVPGKVFIGYDRRYSFIAGNLTSDRMFTYDASGKCLFAGKALGKTCFLNVSSSPDKEITFRLPRENVDYRDALFHAQNNHYFFNDESQIFRIDVYSLLREDYLKVEAELQNAFFESIRPLELCRIDSDENVFEDCGYKKYSFEIKCDVRSQGVYHLRITCACGDNDVYEHVSAFEVFDEETAESPQETSLLPMIYCGDGCATKYSTYNLANQRPDCNIMHYINGSLCIPETAETRKSWELLHLYKRKLLVWMTKRGFKKGDDTYKDYPGTTRNADYINYLYPGIENSRNYFRYDLWGHQNFDAESVREIYDSFRRENPDIRDEFPEIKADNSIDEEKWARISGESFDRWAAYINDKTELLFEEQWKEILAVNPNAKRFSYGPYNAYTMGNSGAYDTKWFGFSKSGLSKVFKGGFLQFEDYPFSCGYQTHVCAWNMATIKQEWKELRIAPEIYDSFPPGCPDGWVGCAFPPTGESIISQYQAITQICEYLYNAAVFDDGAFRYWNDGILQMYESISYEPEKRYEQLLKAWKIHLDNKPVRTLRSTGFITEFDCSDDSRSFEIDTNAIFNKSQSAMHVIHEVNAEMGFPQGFVLKWDSLKNMSVEQSDILVLPSLRKVGADVKNRIRELYRDGIALIATSDVSGLEDIFGVAARATSEKISEIVYDGEREGLYPYTCSLPYEAVDAQQIVCSKDHGLIFRKDRALLINASLSELGVDSYVSLSSSGRANVSRIVRKAIRDFIRSAAAPLAHCDEGCGLTLIETAGNRKLVALTDYSPFSNRKARQVTVWFDGLAVSDIENLPYDEHDIKMNCYKKNGRVDGFSVQIRPHEMLIFRCR